MILIGFRCLSSSWTNEEIRLATGQENSYWAVHPLKLNSSYASVKVIHTKLLLIHDNKLRDKSAFSDHGHGTRQGSTNTRDSTGEPLATSYHSKFLGTVDYLWYSITFLNKLNNIIAGGWINLKHIYVSDTGIQMALHLQEFLIHFPLMSSAEPEAFLVK